MGQNSRRTSTSWFTSRGLGETPPQASTLATSPSSPPTKQSTLGVLFDRKLSFQHSACSKERHQVCFGNLKNSQVHPWPCISTNPHPLHFRGCSKNGLRRYCLVQTPQ